MLRSSAQAPVVFGDSERNTGFEAGAMPAVTVGAERTGSGAGRFYTITYEAVDESGNATVGSAEVLVPDGYRWRHRERIRDKTLDTRRKKSI
jgi:hypothetical protein